VKKEHFLEGLMPTQAFQLHLKNRLEFFTALVGVEARKGEERKRENLLKGM
jgi:hypothetical protein